MSKAARWEERAVAAAASGETVIRADERARMDGQKGASSTERAEAARYFGRLPRTHPVASAARRLCRAAGHQVRNVACGPCWEAAIRADEAFVIECGITAADEVPDPTYVDWVAVERAMSGEPVRLTEREREAVAPYLLAWGKSRTEVGRCLRLSGESLRRILGPVPFPAGRSEQVA